MTGGGNGWREGAAWRSEAPLPPSELKRRERKRRVKRAGGAGSVVGFFAKQALWFVVLVMAMLCVDLILYILIATHEMDRNYLYGTPATVTRRPLTAMETASFSRSTTPWRLMISSSFSRSGRMYSWLPVTPKMP